MFGLSTEMVVWGGENETSTLGTGGRFNPTTNHWTTLPSSGAPSSRSNHSAVWTGSRMIVWGGASGVSSALAGASFAAGGGATSTDDDCDGITEQAGDCNDADPTTFPGASQICDGIDNNCGDPGWPATPAAESDADLDGHPSCDDCAPNDATVYPGAPQLCDGIDNDCDDPAWPAVPPAEGNADADAYLDCADRCPLVASSNNADNDNDGRGNDCDCAPLDNHAWAVPQEARSLMLWGATPTALSWAPPSDPGGSSPRYDVIRAEAPADFATGTCVATNTSALFASDPALPASAFFYLIRSENTCGSSLGADSSGTARVAGPCP